MPVDTQLVDTDVDYCEPDDVFAYIRNKQYGDLPADTSSASQGTLTQEEVDRIIAAKSEYVDTYTKRAWRTRKVVDAELSIKLSHKQKHARHRRRKVRGGKRSRHNFQVARRGFVDLPHTHIKTIDSSQNDLVEILNPRSTNDITDSEGRSDGDYVIDNRKGILRPDLTLLTSVGTNVHGPTLDDELAKVRVSYRYGFPKDVTSYDQNSPSGVSDEVPPDVRDAVALLTAAELVSADQFGEIIPNAGDDTPSLSDAANQWENNAMATLQQYRRR